MPASAEATAIGAGASEAASAEATATDAGASEAASAEPPRRKSMSELPPMDELDSGWDLGEADPTAEPAPPSSSEMAGDAATGNDGIDEPGWD
jgi:hypothetical protein